MDSDGKWDLAEKAHMGFSYGDGYHRLYFKKGYGPAQSVNGIELKVVEPEFFELVQSY